MSDTLSDQRLGRRRSQTAGEAPEGLCTVSVQIAFHEVDAPSAQMLAAEMIARAHELANRPECQCDVDVSVERAPPDAVDEC